MAQYISKAAVVAEIERRIKEIEEIGTYLSPKGVLTNLLCYINTHEVKEVDLDLTPDIDDVLKNNGINPCTTGAKIIKEALYKAIDKHFSKAQKGE